MENKHLGQQQDTDKSNEINLKDLFYDLLHRWRWFAISLSVCLVLGLLVTKSSVKYYNRTASILIKDKKQGGGFGR